MVKKSKENPGILKRTFSAALATASLLIAPTANSARAHFDNYSYWYGFVAGAGGTVCGLLQEGIFLKIA
ncbi:Hypothetical protein PMT_2431 [Prochlorococcus marinus str. MIT 9313]|uniref:Uncharacterized protein n=1 Tax=Prochlorococcus marinus (strain MIT 9313) TaxID=74547 RepID=B9ERP4_PROMM|nr:Hypothetical protein PMT_2431 [Prochlorococcus marinus str. MIT 9313]